MMASHAETANHLTATAACLARHGVDNEALLDALQKGARAIRELLAIKAELEAAAEAEAAKHLDFVAGPTHQP